MSVFERVGGLFRKSRVISSADSSGNDISVVESGDSMIKEMRYNGIVYSRFKRNSIYTGSYWDYLVPPALAFDNPRILVIGLGGGTIQYQLGKLLGKDAVVETVEIDPKVIDLWRRFFPKAGSKVFNLDGIEFVRESENAYDMVILDAYKDLDIPKGFMDDEFVSSANRCLKYRGVLAVNFAQSVRLHSEMEDYIRRLKRFFEVKIVRTGNMADNVALICMKGMKPEELLSALREKTEKFDMPNRILRSYLSWR